jgi:hypothetical protein
MENYKDKRVYIFHNSKVLFGNQIKSFLNCLLLSPSLNLNRQINLIGERNKQKHKAEYIESRIHRKVKGK